jgi:hypothetical protein
LFRPHCQSAGVLSKREAPRRLRLTGVLRRPPTPFGLCAIECRRDHVSPSTGETNRSKDHCEIQKGALQWGGRAALTIGKSAPLALCSASDAASSRAAPRILPGATKDRVMHDILNGSAGNDVLIGGGNDDVFVFAPGDGADTIADFFVGAPEDRIWFAGTDLHSLADVQAHASTVAGNTVITYNGFFTVTLNASRSASSRRGISSSPELERRGLA